MQKERKLEEFRCFRTSKRRKRRSNSERNKESVKEKVLKLRIVYVRKTQKRNKVTKFAIETEEKTFS